ncbi:MAG: A24 family peptidase [Pusillimonas sp.]
MWIPWGLPAPVAFVGALALALLLCVPLSRAAYVLPRRLDAQLSSQPPPVHRVYRAAFWLVAPVLALCCAWRFGATPAAVVAIVYVVVLLALAWIDAETGFLPDILTLPLLCLGVLVNLAGTFAAPADAVVGALAGYLALWAVCWVFWRFTGRQGMGHGDFKLLAALGAWLGWALLPDVIVLSSALALIVAVLRRLGGSLQAGEAFSFGPYLTLTGMAVLLAL